MLTVERIKNAASATQCDTCACDLNPGDEAHIDQATGATYCCTACADEAQDVCEICNDHCTDGNTCSVCQRPVCNKHTAWEHMAELKTENPICVECATEAEDFQHAPRLELPEAVGAPARQPAVKVTFGPEDRKPVQGDLFAPGRPWLSAAEQYCAAEDLALIRWSIDQKFMAGGLWYAVTWDDQAGEWQITPEVDSEGDR